MGRLADDPAALPPRVRVGERWQRRATGRCYEVTAVGERVELRAVIGNEVYRVKPLDLGRHYRRVEPSAERGRAK